MGNTPTINIRKLRLLDLGVVVLAALTLVVTAPILLLSACSPGAPRDSGSGKVTLRLMTWSADDSYALEKQIIDEFRRQNPDIDLQLTYTPYDYYIEKLLTLAVGKDLPDVFWIPQESFPYLANRGVLMDVSDRAGAELNKSLYFPAALELVTYRERLYGLPRDVCCYFMVYNRDMLRQSGLPDPTPDWTWEDFREMGLKLKRVDAEGRPTQFACVWYPFDMIYQNGGMVLDETFSTSHLDKPECYEALQWWSDNVNKLRIAPRGQERDALGRDLFLSQRAAMTVQGPWMLGVYHEQCNFDWDIVSMPQGKAGRKARLLGLPIAISKNTSHPEEAWRLLKFLCYSDEAQSMQGRIGVAMPARADIARGPAFKGQPNMPQGIDIYLDEMENHIVVENVSPFYSRIRRAMDLMLDEATLGRIPCKETAEEADREVEKHIRKAKVRGLVP